MGMENCIVQSARGILGQKGRRLPGPTTVGGPALTFAGISLIGKWSQATMVGLLGRE